MGFPNWETKLKTPQEGCATHLVAAFDPSISRKLKPKSTSTLSVCQVGIKLTEAQNTMVDTWKIAPFLSH
jgi:hypothetical protein